MVYLLKFGASWVLPPGIFILALFVLSWWLFKKRGEKRAAAVLFALTFAFGSGLAGLGGALGIELMGLDPTFPLKFMIYFLIVVTVGGTSTISGPFFAAMLLGVADVAGKYLVPQLGAFIIYALMVILLITRPHGLFVRGRA